ncbi:Hsp20/alpha crystallin family protein [Acidithiobacillus sp. CV18-2]|uniref:Hsp20/alpha crystallin family protein n=1 Tax=Igneacidithiobacillus copahuensis TaxID=2724909 RepID=A0AAE2YNL9_9PROT|nr:Hsp20/alpha crystallin family protein [Igneacidithiobacillus copahuensis]MBU2754610.1 Hsp20/alpha crystallin family protein [Acidithiobacillus sp. CV18-3]MBU2757228.1 Hsp20/alpha crystallin family protein [Acidithiobacillus sp. BN09-2]MBU2776797.1 Hsp20/alpha crystallin family protein [Acidithiobacillus sp. CV18-2]MBU2796455.1 Hsp20/alpha crystallin family protein [Acidithiobacillus sp. VAN18-2]MBU2799473.1 Hsp20/alpha crystallin family protein [Acidithiobacillus sp. VAN18-4]UTV81017.1 Hsp
MSEKAVSNPSVRVADPVEQIFDAVLPGFFRPLQGSTAAARPNVAHLDVIDRDNEIVVKAEIAGVDKDKLDIQVHGNQVYISGSKEEDSSKEEGKYIYRERRYGEFARTIQLPVDVDASQSKAAYKDGVLELTLPKAESAKRRKIAVE